MSKQTSAEITENVSAAFDLLQNARRRGVLYVVERNGETSVEEVAHRIAAWQSVSGRGGPDPEAVETSLVHSHLPKLADAGVVKYDREQNTVELAGSTSGLEPFLQCSREHEPELFHAARTSNLERLKEACR